MKFCMECGTQLPERAKFCSNCGLQLTEQAPVRWDDEPEVSAPVGAPLPVAAPLPESSPWDAPAEPAVAPTYEPPTYDEPPVPLAPHAFREPYPPTEPATYPSALPWETEERDDLVPPPASAYTEELDEITLPPPPRYESYFVDEPAPPFADGVDVPNVPPDPLTLTPTPQGPKQQQNWFMRHKLVTATTLVLSAVIVAAAVNSNNDTPSTTTSPSIGPAASVGGGLLPSPTSGASSTASPAIGGAASGDQARQLGSPASIGGVEATVRTAGFQQSVGEGADGYIVADVGYVNRSGTPKPYSPADWKLETPNGTLMDVSFPGADGQLAAGELAADATASGQITFTVGMEKGSFRIIWQPQGAGSSRGVWPVTIP
jgi:hypothetical protein